MVRSDEELKQHLKKDLASLAKLLKVDTVDFKKQMIVHVSAGASTPSDHQVQIARAEKDDQGKTMTVYWKVVKPQGAIANAGADAGELVLLERFEGTVKFVNER